MNVRVNLNYTIYDGAEIVFKAPCNASEVTGLIVYYPVGTEVVSSVFTFADAHTNDLGNIDDLFAKGAVVKVIIDTETNMAFVQNAATNAYLESRFAGILAPYYVDVKAQGSQYVLVSFDWDEVLRQINSGNTVVCRMAEYDFRMYLPLTSKVIEEYESFIMFSTINDNWYYEFKIYPDGTIFDTASPIDSGGAGGGESVFYVDVTREGESIILNTEFADIVTAHNSGKILECRTSDNEYYRLCRVQGTTFTFVTMRGNGIIYWIDIYEDGSTLFSYTELVERQDFDDLHEVLDHIIEIQNKLIGGDGV